MWISTFLSKIDDAFKIREYVLCPGSRNAALVKILCDKINRSRTQLLFEERSAGFFAIGRILAENSAICVITTSGTAAGELLPAVMEAYHSSLPLIVVTADLPRRFNGKGYPQSTNQVNIFSSFVIANYDIEEGEQISFESDILSRLPDGPIHINLRLEDPKADKIPNQKIALCEPSSNTCSLDKAREILLSNNAPIAIVGKLDEKDHPNVKEFIKTLKIPTYFEALSGLREDSSLSDYRIYEPNSIIKNGSTVNYQVDLVVRIGGIPVHSVWRNLERAYSSLDILSISNKQVTGTARKQNLIGENLNSSMLYLLSELRDYQPPKNSSSLISYSNTYLSELNKLFELEQTSEPGMFYKLSKIIPSDANLYLGNSLPIREWDLAASYNANSRQISASRGLNGIDGQISTFLGALSKTRSNWGIFGDLTTLYDLSAPWLINKFAPQIIIINNSGGKIFERMYSEPEFLNSHNLNFEYWAKMWSLGYLSLTEIPDKIIWDASSPNIIEVFPDKNATNQFWLAYDSLVSF